MLQKVSSSTRPCQVATKARRRLKRAEVGLAGGGPAAEPIPFGGGGREARSAPEPGYGPPGIRSQAAPNQAEPEPEPGGTLMRAMEARGSTRRGVVILCLLQEEVPFVADHHPTQQKREIQRIEELRQMGVPEELRRDPDASDLLNKFGVAIAGSNKNDPTEPPPTEPAQLFQLPGEIMQKILPLLDLPAAGRFCCTCHLASGLVHNAAVMWKQLLADLARSEW